MRWDAIPPSQLQRVGGRAVGGEQLRRAHHDEALRATQRDGHYVLGRDIEKAAANIGVSRTTFWRMRNRAGVYRRPGAFGRGPASPPSSMS